MHVLKNFGTEEYAYLRYIEEHYAMLPQTVSFIQGGALVGPTEISTGYCPEHFTKYSVFPFHA